MSISQTNVSFLGLDWGTNNTSLQTIISLFFLTTLLNPACFLPPNTLTDSFHVPGIILGPEDYEEEEDRSVFETRNCMGETRMETGRGVEYRGAEIEIEAWWGAVWKGEALILPQGPPRSEEASHEGHYFMLLNIYHVLAMNNMYFMLFNIYHVCTIKNLIVISVLWCLPLTSFALGLDT